MNEPIKDTWYYVIVQNPGTSNEQFVGYRDRDTDDSFIPVFNTKEIARQCFLVMPKDIMNNTYEAQAMIKEDLLERAQSNGYQVFLLDDKGVILERLS